MEILKKHLAYEKGDWVRFMRNGNLVVGQIEYLIVNSGGFAYAVTDARQIPVGSILERREPNQQTPRGLQ